MARKEMLKLRPDGKPGLIIFENCKGLREFLPLLQHDETNPSDVAKQPHDITHIPDALRYFAVMRTLPAKVLRAELQDDDLPEQHVTAYDAAMCGGLPTDSYINYR